MYIPHAPAPADVLSARTLASSRGPLTKGSFTLDTSGMASFLGGEVAVAAMTTLHLDPTRRWLGWYNCPGTYEVARRYGRSCKSRFLEGLFPGVPTDLATLLGLANIKGAKYIGAVNGAILEETGPFTTLLMKECRDQAQPVRIKGRTSKEVHVTISELAHEPAGRVVLCTPIYSRFVAVVPMLVSFGTAAACAAFGDWVCFSMIVLGTLVHGISCVVIGSGEFTFNYPVSSFNTSGDGILVSEKEGEFAVLKGSENAVNSVTRGAGTLTFDTELKGHYDICIKWCSIALVFQLIAQLLFIPQGSLFGQIMFIGSLAVSWAYNLWLSSRDKEKIQREVFVNGVLGGPKSRRFTLGTRTTAVVFMLLVLDPKDHNKIMDMLLPNGTPGWRKLKNDLLPQIQKKQEPCFDASWWEDPAVVAEKDVLEKLCEDAQAAYQGYRQFYVSSPSLTTLTS
ncbi:hypothetical protein V8B97DRAFT_697322 [Scleroderma yunnanense]